MSTLLLSGRILLAVVFGAAGLAKAFDPAGSRKAVSDFGLPKLLGKPAAFVLPVVELVIAILLLSTSGAVWGAAVAIALLLGFAIAITVNLLKGRHPDCHCFGQLHSRPISWGLVVRNVAFATGASAILSGGPGMSMASALRRFMEIAIAQPLPVAAVLVAVTGFVVQTFLFLGLFQQHGRLLLRMDKLEHGASGDSFALTPPAIAGLPIGAPAPPFELSSADGRLLLQELLTVRNAVLLVFTDPDCGACAELLPDIGRWQRLYAEMVTFVIISRVPATTNGRPEENYAFRNVAWQKDREISQSYKINGIPAAVVVRPDGTIGTWIATGRSAIQSLITFLLYTRMLATSNELAQPIRS